MAKWAATFVLVCVSLAAALSSAGADEGDTRLGARLFGANCFQCHGSEGGGGIAPRLSGPGNAASWPFERFRAAVMAGYGEGNRSLNEIMPHFGYVKIAPSGRAPTDAELHAIQSYLQSVKPGPRPAAT
jgi:mono/diheme cytochrome c family protein